MRRPDDQARAGFTITELMTVVILIGIIAAIAIPTYIKAVEQGYRRTARDLLQTIYAGEQVYESVNSEYVDPLACPPPDPAWRCIYMDDPHTPNVPVTYTVAAGGGAFTATATRTGGACSGRVLTVNQSDRTPVGDWPENGAC